MWLNSNTIVIIIIIIIIIITKQCCCSEHASSQCMWCDNNYYYTRLTALFPGLPRWASTRKVKPIRMLLKQETVSGSGISWAIYKSAPRSRQITMPAPHHSKFFTGRMPFLPPNQQRQSTEGWCDNNYHNISAIIIIIIKYNDTIIILTITQQKQMVV